MASYYERNRDEIKAKTKAYRDAHLEYYRERARAAKQRNPRTAEDRAREKDRWKAKRGLHDAHVHSYRAHPKPAAVRPVLHDAHVRALRDDSTVWYRWRYANDEAFALHERMRRQLRKKMEAVPNVAETIRAALRRGSSSNAVECLLGYSIDTLRLHLEAQFVDGMTWQTHSRHGWHIDHRLPKRCFDLTTIEGVRSYWSLTNLRPLPAVDNLRKGARIEGRSEEKTAGSSAGAPSTRVFRNRKKRAFAEFSRGDDA